MNKLALAIIFGFVLGSWLEIITITNELKNLNYKIDKIITFLDFDLNNEGETKED